jgi:ribosomal protein S12 methylthiotransferase accessory factor
MTALGLRAAQSAAVQRDDETREADLRNLVDDKFGPLFRFHVQKLQRPMSAWWLATAALARCPVGAWFASFAVTAGGTSIDRHEAIARCLGEGAERYAALNSLTTLPMRVGPSADALLDLFPRCDIGEGCGDSFKGIAADLQITQTRVRRLDNDDAVWIPAGYVHLGFIPGAPEPAITLPISTGLAFARDLVGAIWRGLCEVVERDAIMLSWLRNKPKSELLFADCDYMIAQPEIWRRIEALRAQAIQTRLFDISIDFDAPVVLCVLQSAAFPHFAVGASCHENPGRACCKAIDEAVAVRVASQKPSLAPPSAENLHSIDRLEAHAALYANWADSPAMQEFGENALGRRLLVDFLNDAFPQAPSSLAELREVAARMSLEDATVLWADLTTPDLAELGHVVRVVVPEFMPLSQRSDARWLATPRLHRVLRRASVDASEINKYPHPFS